MIVFGYIMCAIAIVCLFVMFVIMDRVKDIQDDLQLIRMRVFKPTEEEPDIMDTETNEDEKISDKELMKVLQTHSKDIRAAYDELRDVNHEIEYIKTTLKEHAEKLNDIYIEE